MENLINHFKFRRGKGQRNEPLYTIHGHFSLKTIRGAKFPGCQTAATSMCALLQAKSLSPSSWSPEVIDRLLLQGDKLHTTRLRDLDKSKNTKRNLTPDELPTHLESRQMEFNISFRKLLTNSSRPDKLGHLLKQNDLTMQSACLKTLLSQSLDNDHAGVLLTAQGITIAVICNSNNKYCYIFHPLEKSRKRLTAKSHQAALLTFRDIDHVSRYISSKVFTNNATYSRTAVDMVTENKKSISRCIGTRNHVTS